MSKRLFLLGALPLIIWAQELEKITVKADSNEKRDIKEASFYRTYTQDTVTKEDIQQNIATDIKDALSDIPGVQVTETGSFSKSLKIRGLGRDRVISVVDGMKLANQGITHSGGGELGLIDLSTVEKIELVKGSPAVVYDPGATGGIIKVSTIKDVSNMKDGAGGKYTYGFDDGYMMNTHSLFLEGKYKNFYTSLTGTKKDSNGRNVKNRENIEKAIKRTNYTDERIGTRFVITDLGYDSDSYQFFGSYKINDKATVFVKNSNYQANDLSFTHGGVDATLFHYDEYSRKSSSISVESNNLLYMDKINSSYNHQVIEKMMQYNELSKNIINVESDTFKIDATKYIDEYELLFGMERTNDEADTYVKSEQEYTAAYLNGAYNHENFTLTAGARYNYYKVKQHIPPGRNLDIIYDLVGVSGVLKDPLSDSGWSYATGATYLINDTNNLSLNYSKTYRYPTLYERFAFDTFIGGGKNMKAEEGDSFEISYKYLDDTFSATATIFYIDFDIFNRSRDHRGVNQASLAICNQDPNCDPEEDDSHDLQIFTHNLLYTSFEDVKNSGFELTFIKDFEEQNIKTNFNISLNKLTDAKVLLKGAKEPFIYAFNQDPLEFSAYIKKDFSYKYSPWVKLKMRHVTNKPEVKQEEGFSSFTTANLYFGAKYKNITFNGGIRNLTDKVYHEPYMGLDGLKRTFYMNLSASF